MIDRYLDWLLRLPRLPRWFAAFFTLTFAMFLVTLPFFLPILLIGPYYDLMAAGLIGCPLGVGIGNATMITFCY